MTLWEEEFEGVRNRWLRWTDAQGELIPTGKQRAEEEAAARQAAEPASNRKRPLAKRPKRGWRNSRPC